VTNERQQDEAAVTDRVEDVVRAAAVLAARGAELSATRHQQDVRRAARAGAAAAAMIVAFGSAFVFANWAAGQALSSSLASWRAPLVLAGAWLLVAVVSAVVLLRLEPGLRRLGRSPDDPAVVLARQQAAFDEAQTSLRHALEALAGAIGEAVQHEIAAAVLPDGVVDLGDSVVDATEEALELVDEVTDAMEARFPGGVIVNRAVDYALVPGRIGVRAVRLVVSFGQPPGEGLPPKE
jgi:hypothetical protein